MNEKEIKDLQDSIIKELSTKIEMEIDSKIKGGFRWIVILLTSLATLFLAFVTLSLTNMINLSSFKEEIRVSVADMKNQDKSLSDNLRSIRIEVSIPIQLALAKANMVQALVEKDMNAYYRYSEMVTKLEIEVLTLKYPQEQIRGSK